MAKRYSPSNGDPSGNVWDLVAGAVERLDDLRELDVRVNAAEASHVRQIMGLRADYDEKLRLAESARIDAIRAVDVGNVQRAAQVAATQTLTLQTQVATTAEALRIQQVASEQQAAIGLAAALNPIKADIADLRKAQYQQAGQQAQVVESKVDYRSNLGLIYALISLIGVFIFGIAAAAIALLVR